MKQNIILILIATLFTFCSLDLPLQDEASGMGVIANEESAQEFLAGAYADFPKNQYLAVSVLAGDFFLNANMFNIANDDARSLSQLYRWDVRNLKESGDDCWTAYYSSLQRINMILGAEKEVKQSAKWSTIKAQALSLKALIYIELLSLYSDSYEENNMGIVLRESFDYSRKGRSSAKECVDEINKLLDESLALQSDKKRSTNFLDYYATLLLKARIALYVKDYEAAIKLASEIRDEIGYKKQSITPSSAIYATLWTNDELSASRCPEKLFAFSKESLDFMLKPYYGHLPSGDYISIHEDFNFSESDYRNKLASFPFVIEGKSQYLMGKYRKDMKDIEPKDLNTIRLAECYFILAESYLHKNKNTVQAQEVLNEFLTYRNADLVNENLSFEQMDEKILFEKRKEFIGEGLNFFDTKRRGKAVELYEIEKTAKTKTIEATDYRFTWPIPLQEIKESDNLVKQNRDWPSL